MSSLDRRYRSLREEYVRQVVGALEPPEDDEVSRTLRQTRTDVSNEGTPPLHAFEHVAFTLLNLQRTSRSPMEIKAELVKLLESLFKPQAEGAVGGWKELFPGLPGIFEAVLGEKLIDKPVDELEQSVFEDLGKHLGIFNIEGNFNQRNIAPRLKQMVRSRLVELHEIERSKRTEADVVACVLHIVLDFYQMVHAQDIDKLHDEPLQPIHPGPVDWAIAGQSAWRVGVFGASTYAVVTVADYLSHFAALQRAENIFSYEVHHSVSAMACFFSLSFFSIAWRWRIDFEQLGCYRRKSKFRNIFVEAPPRMRPFIFSFAMLCGLDLGIKMCAVVSSSLDGHHLFSVMGDFYDQRLDCKAFIEAEFEHLDQSISAWCVDLTVDIHKLLVEEAQGESGLGLRWKSNAALYFAGESFRLLEDAEQIAAVSVPDGLYSTSIGDGWRVAYRSNDSWLATGPIETEEGQVRTIGWLMNPDDGGVYASDLLFNAARNLPLEDDKDLPGPHILDEFLLTFFGRNWEFGGMSFPEAMYGEWLKAREKLVILYTDFNNSILDPVQGEYLFERYANVQIASHRWHREVYHPQLDSIFDQMYDSMREVDERYMSFDALLREGRAIRILDEMRPIARRDLFEQCRWYVPSGREFLFDLVSKRFEFLMEVMLKSFLIILLFHADFLAYGSVYRRYEEDQPEVQEGLRRLQAKLEKFTQIIHAHSNVGPMVDLYNPWKKTEEGEVESVEEPPFSFEALRFFVRRSLLRTSVPNSQSVTEFLDVALGRLSHSAVAHNRLVYLAQEVLFKDAALLENQLMGDPKRKHEHPRHVIDEVCRDETRNHQVLRRRFHAALRNNVKKIEKRK